MNPATTTAENLVADVIAAATAVRIAGSAAAHGPRRLSVRSPVNGEAWTEVVIGGENEALAAMTAASDALPAWAATATADRADGLRRIADDLEAAATSSWPELISRETGKRIAESRAELGLSAVYFRVFADLTEHQRPERFEVVAGHAHTVEAEPIGVVAALTPWNFPVSIPARKLAAILAAGCTAVFKPSELAPLSSMVLSALIDRHLPSGVVNTVLGEPSDVVEPWLADARLGAVSFTGSTRVGGLIAASAAPRFLRSVMELGGCAPFVVLADADPEQAAQTLMVAKYRNNGQSCIAANQIFVAREVAGPFVDAFVAATAALDVGDPLDEATGLGPMAPAGDPARLNHLVDAAVAGGARIVSETVPVPGAGHYVAPAVLVDVPESAALFTGEIFGPVAAIRTFDDVGSAIAEHHRTGYGLAGYVCGTDTDAAAAVARRLRAGIVGINTGTPNYPGAPFSGTGLSGIGYEGGRLGLDEFQHYRTTAVGGS